jgi:hypothetical protein
MSNYERNVSALASRFRVLIPDLPATAVRQDLRADDPAGDLASAMLGLLDALGLASAHIGQLAWRGMRTAHGAGSTPTACGAWR